MKKHQEAEIRFLVTLKQNFVSETLQNGIPFPLKTKFHFRITLLYKPQQHSSRCLSPPPVISPHHPLSSTPSPIRLPLSVFVCCDKPPSRLLRCCCSRQQMLALVVLPVCNNGSIIIFVVVVSLISSPPSLLLLLLPPPSPSAAYPLSC